jgi:hypothetical protein
MIHKLPSPFPGHVRVVFELPSCLWADRIYLIGDFNQWDEQSTPMQQERDGVWRARVDLPIGNQYQFRYMIDGQWKTDNHADGFAQGIYGTDNSVVYAALPAPILEEASALVQDSRPLRQLVAPTEFRTKYPTYDVRESNRMRTPVKQLAAA